MNVTFTICTANYLAQAKTLGYSLLGTNPEVEFRIYLIDKLENSKASRTDIPFTIIEIEKLGIIQFDGMASKYNLVELNTSVKPFIVDTIFNTESNVQNVIYFDPDIKVYSSLEKLLEKLTNYSVVLTPHSLSPSDSHPYGQPEVNYLSTGIFNLGFVAFSRSQDTFKVLEWWKEKLQYQGYCDHQKHLFFDQKWMNLAPVFFNRILIEKSKAFNMAGWNLHERFLTEKNGFHYVDGERLLFYHFSGVSVEGPEVSKYTKYSFDERPDLVKIVSEYRSEVLKNGYSIYKNIPCYYKQKSSEISSTSRIRTLSLKSLKALKKRVIRTFLH